MIYHILNKNQGNTWVNHNYQIDISAGLLRGIIGNGATNNNLVSIKTVNAGTWRHVAFTVDGTNLILYIDGAIDNTKAQTITPIITLSLPRDIARYSRI